jgi:hypothetical protein
MRLLDFRVPICLAGVPIPCVPKAIAVDKATPAINKKLLADVGMGQYHSCDYILPVRAPNSEGEIFLLEESRLKSKYHQLRQKYDATIPDESARNEFVENEIIQEFRLKAVSAVLILSRLTTVFRLRERKPPTGEYDTVIGRKPVFYAIVSDELRSDENWRDFDFLQDSLKQALRPLARGAVLSAGDFIEKHCKHRDRPRP